MTALLYSALICISVQCFSFISDYAPATLYVYAVVYQAEQTYVLLGQRGIGPEITLPQHQNDSVLMVYLYRQKNNNDDDDKC